MVSIWISVRKKYAQFNLYKKRTEPLETFLGLGCGYVFELFFLINASFDLCSLFVCYFSFFSFWLIGFCLSAFNFLALSFF